MTDLINNIVKEFCFPDDWRKIIKVPVYKGKGDPLVCGSYRDIILLEQPMKVLERVLEKKVRCQLITCSLASCLAREPLKPFSACDKYKRNTKQRRRSCAMFILFGKGFDRVTREVVRWGLRKLCVDEWLIRTVMALYTEVCTVVKTDAGLSEGFAVNVDLHEG